MTFPLIELDEDRDVWVITEWFSGDFIPPVKPVLRFPLREEELMSVNLLVA